MGLTRDRLSEMYSIMCTIRRFERMTDQLYATGRDDYLVNHHRGHRHIITKGAEIHRMMEEFLGKDAGNCRGRGGSMHIADFAANNLGANGIVGGGIPITVGVGLALQMQASDRIVVGNFGDRAANEGASTRR